MRAVDLFAGAGGFSLGFQRAGFQIAAAYDNEPSAMALHARNLPAVPTRGLRGHGVWAGPQRRGGRHRLADLTNLLAAAPDVAELRPDVIVGGPPCQGFSNSGKRGGDNDPRSLLTEAYAVVVCAAAPTYFVMENVQQARKYKVYRRATDMLRRAGYGLSEHVVDMSFLGVGQRRERLILMGCRGEADNWAAPYIQAAKSERPTTVRDVLGDGVGEAYFRIGHRKGNRVSFRSVDEPGCAITTTADRRKSSPEGYVVRPSDETFLVKQDLVFIYPGGSSSPGTRSIDEPAPTLTRRAWDGPGKRYKARAGDVLDVRSLPVLDFSQLAALSGFPADWVWQPETIKPLSKAKRMLALANAVPPPAAERFGRIIRAHHRGSPPTATVEVKLVRGFGGWMVKSAKVSKRNVKQRLSEVYAALRLLNGRVVPRWADAERFLHAQHGFRALGKSRRSNLTTSLKLYYRFLESRLPVWPDGYGERDREEPTAPFPPGFAALRERMHAASAAPLQPQDESDKVVLLQASA